ncbi:hypothetical protein AC579_2580 [Pseudocercospora musae]|uniref:F-box domain-containing protein n=1 Tax=Pseudocercospora musae TaxID=113226 RepID=A0A139IF56_9PEZI|nr:hypothetical protein AC579_2580 [Pseudocercospora musae]
MASPALSAVLNTTELLELILLNLPPAERLAARRVCRHFESCFVNSIACWKPIFLNAEEEEWWAIHRARQEIIRVAPETDRVASERQGWTFVRPAILNGLILEETWPESEDRSVFSAYDARARVKLDLAKVNNQSLCTWLPLLYGTRATGKVFVWNSANPADLDNYRKPYGRIVFEPQPKNIISVEFYNLCSAVSQFGGDLTAGIQIEFADTIIVTDEMLAFVRRNGKYKLPFIAREENGDLIRQIASHLNPRDLRNLLTSCNDLKRMMHLEEVESTIFLDSMAFAEQKVLVDANLKSNAVLVRLDDRLAKSRTLFTLQVIIHEMNRKSQFGRISSSGHFALLDVVVFNQNIFQRCFRYTSAAEQAKAGFALLEPTFSGEKKSSDDADQTVCQDMIERTSTFITIPPTNSIQLEVVSPGDGRIVWMTMMAAERVSDNDSFFVTVGQLFATMKKYDGTGRIRIPGVIAAKQEEWVKLQTLPVLAQEDVERFE